MAWEYRGNKLYYYRKKRERNRVVSEYVGTGLSATLTSEMDRIDREKNLESLTQWRAQKAEIRKIEAEIEHLSEIVYGLVRVTLLTSGYHPHKGQWRKRQHG